LINYLVKVAVVAKLEVNSRLAEVEVAIIIILAIAEQSVEQGYTMLVGFKKHLTLLDLGFDTKDLATISKELNESLNHA
jgi:hypothetical protein